MVQPHDDSGLFTLGDVLLSFVPGLGTVRAAQAPLGSLRQLRLIFSAFATAVVVLGVVVAVLTAAGTTTDSSTTGVAFGVAAVGVGSLFLPAVIAPPLDCSSPQSLIGSYRTRFFIRLAYAEAPALLGFFGFFMTGQGWLYLVGFVFSLIGFVRLAPTAASVSFDQEALNEAGCGLSLQAVLRSQ